MTTYQPFEEIHRPLRGLFAGLSSGPPGSVVVVDREGHKVRTLLDPQDRLTAGEARFGRIRTLYQVDVGEHPLQFEEVFPCLRANGAFHSRVLLTCRVADPEAVVHRQVRDVSALLKPLVCAVIRQACQQFEAEQQADAERSAQEEVQRVERNGGFDPAFTLSRIQVEIGLDSDADSYVKQLKEDERHSRRQSSAAGLERDKAQFEAELARQQQQAELDRQRHEVLVQTEHQVAELEQLRRRSDAELALQRVRVEHYLTVLGRGDIGLVALQMVRDKTSVSAVIERLTKERHDVGQQQLEALALLLKYDALESWQAHEQAVTMITQLVEMLKERPTLSSVRIAEALTVTSSDTQVTEDPDWEPSEPADDEDMR